MKPTSLLLAALLASVLPLAAAPTAGIKAGATTVTPASSFLEAATSLGVQVAPLKGRVLRFPITGGTSDLANARGEIHHSGGLSLTAGSTVVQLRDFTIDTTATPVLTGMVVANGSVVGRVPLFKVGLPSLTLPLEPKQQRLLIPGATLSLTAEAATALNGAFGVSAFTENFAIGTADVAANGVKVD
jgi:hypothetical protein